MESDFVDLVLKGRTLLKDLENFLVRDVEVGLMVVVSIKQVKLQENNMKEFEWK